MPSHTGGLGTSTNHHPTFVYISDRHSTPTELMSPEQGACALFIEDAAKHHFSPPVEQCFGFSPSCYVPPQLRVENNQHTWCVFEPPLWPEKHNNIVQLLTSELSCACHLLACCQQSYKTVYLYWVWGEESLELEKAHGNLLGERAMAEAVG